MNEFVAAGLLLVAAVAAFALSVRVGMLLGLRLDRHMEADAEAEEQAEARIYESVGGSEDEARE